MTPLVSILIPAYNAQAWIAECIESALAQTWERKEIIVVNDGSTDETFSIAKRYVSQGVAVITKVHAGAAAARNKAFSLCQGDYIQWLDADDLLAPDKIERQMGATGLCRSRRTLISGSWGKFFFRTSKAQFRPTSLWADLAPVEWLVRKMGDKCFMQTGTWLVSRELTEAAGPWDTRLMGDDDGEYFCRVILKSDGIKYVDSAKVYYRVTDSKRLSINSFSDTKLEALFLSMQNHIRCLRELEDSQRSRDACLKYLQWYMIDFFPERADIVQQLRRLAAEFGGELKAPRFSWRYVWVEWVFGFRFAKRMQFWLPRIKLFAFAVWDHTLFRLTKQGWKKPASQYLHPFLRSHAGKPMPRLRR